MYIGDEKCIYLRGRGPLFFFHFQCDLNMDEVRGRVTIDSNPKVMHETSSLFFIVCVATLFFSFYYIESLIKRGGLLALVPQSAIDMQMFLSLSLVSLLLYLYSCLLMPSRNFFAILVYEMIIRTGWYITFPYRLLDEIRRASTNFFFQSINWSFSLSIQS